MRRHILIAAAVLAAVQSAGARQARSAPGTYTEAYEAWDRGDYVVALERLKALTATADEAAFERIALLTGELYQTQEVTADGRAPSISADGTLLTYETGPTAAPITRIVRNAPGFPVVAEIAGRSAVVDPAGRSVIYQTADGRAWRARQIGGQEEAALDFGGLTAGTLVRSEDGGTIFFAGAAAGVTDRNDIYSATPGTLPKKLTDTPGLKGALRIVPGGSALLFTIAGTGGRGGGANSTPAVQGYIDLRSGDVGTIEGAAAAPVFSADGGTLAYVSRDGASYKLMIRSGRSAPTAVLTTTDRIDAPALSPDGSRIAFQRMTRDDWEVYVSDREGKTITRVTREIQHDVLPRFLTNTRLMALIGEARHRRSYFYDLTTGSQQRLFHNNTVRTIAPEYIWQTSSDGSKVLIQADRDGNTVSPARGVYIVDLTKKISRADLSARIDANLAAERRLRTFAARVTRPLAATIRGIVDRASVTRVFGYEKALFDFDSKHITQPGNLKASEFLHATYASFGYTPEYQWFSPNNALGGRTANVVATLKGTRHPEVIYVVSSHYDSGAAGPGADDDTSGTAALLETARLMAGHPQPATIVFASFTGEEAGLLGSREFVRLATQNKWKVAGALNNDMIGWANDHRLDNTIRYSNPGIKDVQHAVALTFTDLITYDAMYYRSTDAQAFYDAWGDIVGGIGSYPVLGNPHYHQSHDFLETINHQLITEVAKTTAATLVTLANTPARLKGLTAKVAGTGAALAWETSPESDVRQYVVSWQPKGGPARRVVVTGPAATIADAPAGTEVRVIAVNARGLEGWDYARVIVR